MSDSKDKTPTIEQSLQMIEEKLLSQRNGKGKIKDNKTLNISKNTETKNPTLSNLFEQNKNQAGKGISRKGDTGFSTAKLSDIFSGKHPNYAHYKFKSSCKEEREREADGSSLSLSFRFASLSYIYIYIYII